MMNQQPLPLPLRFGMFLMPVHDPAKPLAQCYDEDLELVCLCEELGFDEFWCGEHHSSALENIVMPEVFLAKASALTGRIRLGPAPVCLQYHNPVHVAGRLAFLDHLMHGRLNVCFGPGAVPTDLEAFGVDPQRSGAMVAEAIELILRIWTSDPPYEFAGQFWKVELKRYVSAALGIGGLHKPLQRPHPPIAVPCISRDSSSVRLAAARGFSPFSHHMIHHDVLRSHWETYARAAEGSGRQPQRERWKVSRNVFVAETTAEAQRLARANSLGRCIQYILDLTKFGAGNLKMWKPDPEMSEADCNLDYFLREIVIAGDPAHVTERLSSLYRELGGFGTLVLVAHDWDDKAAWVRSLELFGREVMPALRRSVGA